jgi:hypothetical protein
VNPSSISGFSYLEGEGPSAAQMFSVTGENLSENIVVQAPANYEISSSETTGFSPTITLTQVGGAVAETPLYARLEAGLSIADYNNELITVNSAGAMEVTISLSGSVTGPEPFVNILQRPAQINLADSAYESAVLVEIGNYPTDDVRYRLYNGGTQYYPWDDVSGNWISSTSYSSGPLVPGTATTSTSWWIPFQVGSNPTTSASYRDRLGPTYPANYQTQALPAATSIVSGVPILSSQVNFNIFSDYSAKHVVLAYDASETLIAAASTNIGDGAFTIWVEDGTTISRIEVRDVLNNLIESVTGTWPQVLNPQIILTGEVEPLFSVEGLPSEEITSYYLSSDDLTQDIAVVAPNPFEISTSTEGPWGNTLNLTPSFEGTIYIRLNSPTVGTFAGDITHNSPGATEVTLRVEGETLAATGEIIVVESLLPFSNEVGTPSATQSYSLSATDLDTDITITSQAPFEVSQDGSTGWATVITVPGTYNGLIYVRMNADAPGDYNDIDILHSNPIASPVTITVSGTATAAGGVVDDIFFSEYLEGGSGNNKYIEIFNATDHTVDLSRYQVELYNNGASTASNIEILSGNLLSGEVLVIANSGSVPAILDEADIYSTVCYFNGDDALILRCLNPDTVVDVIGTMGTDPGTGWDVAGTTAATANHVLVRKPTVSSGNADWAVQAGTDANNSEWVVHPDMYLDDLGIHTYNPGALITSAPVFNPAGGLYAQAQSVTISCANPEAEIRYSTDGTDPSETVGTLYTDPIPVSENTTIKAIAYAPGYDPSIIVEAVYTFVTPISDIATLRTQPTGAAYSYTLTGEAVLTFQQSNRNQKYIQDATAAIVIDDNAGNITTIYNLYDGITGITGYLSVYGGLVQFIPTADPGAASSTNNVVIPEVRTLASLTSADQAKLIKVMDTTISGMAQFPSYAANLTATDASGAATLRTFPSADYAGTDVPLDPVNLICLVGEYNGSMQVSPRFLSDIETSGGALDSPIPSITLDGANVVLSWNDVDGAGSYRIEAADDPYGTFTTVDTTTNINYSVAAGSAKKFYRIIALP